MNTKNIIQRGTEPKYLIEIDREGFDMSTDDFAVRLSYGMQGGSITITKSDMRQGIDGKWLMCFSTDDMVGAVTASCMIQVPDNDIPGGTMAEVDRQILCFVASTPNPHLIMYDEDTKDHIVHYTRTTEPNVLTKESQAEEETPTNE